MNSSNIDYISLGEAAKLTNYSQEYISLLCRQKKLKGTKIGRNWVTTKEWIENYVNKTKGSGENVIPVKVKNIKKQSISNVSRMNENKNEVSEQKVTIACSSNEQKNSFPHAERSILVFFRKMILATFVVIFGIGFVFFSEHILYSAKLIFSETEKNMVVVSSDLNSFLGSFSENRARERSGIVAGVKTFVDEEDSSETEDQKTNKGIVIIPLEDGVNSEENQELIEKLSSSFSDDVKIYPSGDGVSGVITSLENTDENYLYLMVPVKE